MAIDTLTGAAGMVADVDKKLFAIISAELGHYYAKYDTRPIASQKARDNYKKVGNNFKISIFSSKFRFFRQNFDFFVKITILKLRF